MGFSVMKINQKAIGASDLDLNWHQTLLSFILTLIGTCIPA